MEYYGFFVLLILPIALLCAAWASHLGSDARTAPHGWRGILLRCTLVASLLSSIATLIFLFSNFKNGAGIHGSTTSPGLWKIFGPVSFWALAATMVAATLGKGKGRGLILASGVALLGAEYVILMTAID